MSYEKKQEEIAKEMQDLIGRLDSFTKSKEYSKGYSECQKEYEEKLRWIPIYEPPKTAELVIVDSGENLHACVAVAFFENGIWKYANGQKLWFAPRRWRSFL